jgi:hypothetical protein
MARGGYSPEGVLVFSPFFIHCRAGLCPGAIGLFQITVRVPAVKTGAYRLVVKVNGVPSNAIIIDVAGIRSGASAALKRDQLFAASGTHPGFIRSQTQMSLLNDDLAHWVPGNILSAKVTADIAAPGSLITCKLSSVLH